MAGLLLVTATALEAEPLKEALNWEACDFPLGELYRAPSQPVYLAHFGLAKVNTAAGLALASEYLKPAAVLQFGIGGAYSSSGLSIPMLAVATQEVHLDTGIRTEEGWQGVEALGFPMVGEHYNIFPTDLELTQAIAEITGARPCSFGASETVTGSFEEADILQARFGVSLESMEGAAAAQVCCALKTPFAELRAVSNIVGERDKAVWEIPAAVEKVNWAVFRYLENLYEGSLTRLTHEPLVPARRGDS